MVSFSLWLLYPKVKSLYQVPDPVWIAVVGVKRKAPVAAGNRILGIQPVASHFSDWSIVAHNVEVYVV
jgi:hypothetical protein